MKDYGRTIDIESNIVYDLIDRYNNVENELTNMQCSAPETPAFLDVESEMNDMLETVQESETKINQSLVNCKTQLEKVIDELLNNDIINDIDIMMLLSMNENSINKSINNSESRDEILDVGMIHINLTELGVTKAEVELYFSNLSFVQEAAILRYLSNCVPENYSSFNFAPTEKKFEEIESALNLFKFANSDAELLKNYHYMVEAIEVNGKMIDFLQVIPKNSSSENGVGKADMLVYDVMKANAINTLRTLPSAFTDSFAEKTNAFVIGPNSAMVCSDLNTMGYYLGIGDVGSITILVDSFLGLPQSKIQDMFVHTIPHEMGHNYDDSLNGYPSYEDRDAIIQEHINYSRLNSMSHEKVLWNCLRENNYKNLVRINQGGYGEEKLSQESYTHEFYAECIATYFTNGEELERYCPEVYEEISNQLGGNDYGDAYNKNINGVLQQ